MPIHYDFALTPGGHRYFRTSSTGVVSAADADGYKRRLTEPDVAGLPLVSIIRRDADVSSEARKSFSSITGGTGSLIFAFVVESAAARVMMAFIFRVIGMAPTLFSNEADAVRHIDAQLQVKPPNATPPLKS
ncbi:MAG: hypothetical protein JNG84_11415 [Archangium sp.]|nr:hypothetical protein [Archangium sp.]